MKALEQTDSWPAETVAVGVVARGDVAVTQGPPQHGFRWASVTKPVTALAVLVAVEEGSVDLDEPAGPSGSTVRHLLAHASGLPFEGREPISPPERRRIYSNTGFDVLADHVSSRAGMAFEDYLRAAVLEPLGTGAELRGRAGSGLFGSLQDLIALARELLAPTLIASETLAEATTVQFPGLAGVIPDLGRFDPNDWGLGFDLKNGKPGHFSGATSSPRTFGHWGGAGTFVWVDPEAEVACGCLTDLDFGDWAKAAWPRLSDAILAELA